MKVYSDTLTINDLYACLPSGVGIAGVREIGRARKRARGWELSLEGYDARHTRRTNSGQYGAGERFAATWDDHGVWMNNLYERDPNAHIAWYENREDFYEKTAREMLWRRDAKRGVRAEAPWLNGVTQ